MLPILQLWPMGRRSFNSREEYFSWLLSLLLSISIVSLLLNSYYATDPLLRFLNPTSRGLFTYSLLISDVLTRFLLLIVRVSELVARLFSMLPKEEVSFLVLACSISLRLPRLILLRPVLVYVSPSCAQIAVLFLLLFLSVLSQFCLLDTRPSPFAQVGQITFIYIYNTIYLLLIWV